MYSPSLAARPLADRFPTDFTWGAATAAYQIEGSVRADGRGASVWDTFSHTPGKVVGGDTGDVACDHYRRWESDLDLMADLGLRAYRFSVAWPRIQPTGSGPANQAGLDFYDRLVDGLLARGIQPWVTLYHWDLPQALEDAGGWTAPGVVDRFAEYAAIVAERLGDRVVGWITLNELRTHAFIGYGTGRHAPGRTGWATALRAGHHELLAHAAGVRAIRAAAPAARVGVCHDVAHVVPATDRPEDLAATERYRQGIHDWFLGPTFGRGYPAELAAWYEQHGILQGLDLAAVDRAEPIDFLALNYYHPDRIHDAPVRDTWGFGAAGLEGVGELAGNGWEILPDGMRAVLNWVNEAYRPPAIAITENGATFPDRIEADGSVQDEARRSYIERHVRAAAEAIDDGVPLIGYFAWSLLDNFEWALGYGTRFGIVHVDYETQRRTVKASGRWYRDLLAGAV
ncbi:MAG: GH1 family beta-glucosidase [Chloroflexota bacterium]|nr:GH1 family beta-glucosidase [Chloroflexota bacterium]